MMSPVPSPRPASLLAPPGVYWSRPWPNSWPTTSIEEIHSLDWLWPIETDEPSQYALTSFRPTFTGQLPPLPLWPLRPSQSRSMSHSFCAANITSAQPVSLEVALPLPQESEDFENTWPVE